MTNRTELGFDELLDEVRRNVQVATRTQFPGTVVAFRRNPRPTADILMGLNTIIVGNEQVEVQLERVPVMYYTASGITIQSDLEVGDEVWVSVADRDISSWIEGGGNSRPNVGRLHDVSDAVCEPKIQSNKFLPRVTPGKKTLRIGAINGDDEILLDVEGSTITINAGSIKIGGGAVEQAVLGNTLDTFLNAVKLWLDTHTHPVAGAVAGPSLPPSPAVTNILSSKVDVE
jgi:hypothetical protein